MFTGKINSTIVSVVMLAFLIICVSWVIIVTMITSKNSNSDAVNDARFRGTLMICIRDYQFSILNTLLRTPPATNEAFRNVLTKQDLVADLAECAPLHDQYHVMVCSE